MNSEIDTLAMECLCGIARVLQRTAPTDHAMIALCREGTRRYLDILNAASASVKAGRKERKSDSHLSVSNSSLFIVERGANVLAATKSRWNKKLRAEGLPAIPGYVKKLPKTLKEYKANPDAWLNLNNHAKSVNVVNPIVNDPISSSNNINISNTKNNNNTTITEDSITLNNLNNNVLNNEINNNTDDKPNLTLTPNRSKKELVVESNEVQELELEGGYSRTLPESVKNKLAKTYDTKYIDEKWAAMLCWYDDRNLKLPQKPKAIFQTLQKWLERGDGRGGGICLSPELEAKQKQQQNKDRQDYLRKVADEAKRKKQEENKELAIKYAEQQGIPPPQTDAECEKYAQQEADKCMNQVMEKIGVGA